MSPYGLRRRLLNERYSTLTVGRELRTVPAIKRYDFLVDGPWRETRQIDRIVRGLVSTVRLVATPVLRLSDSLSSLSIRDLGLLTFCLLDANKLSPVYRPATQTIFSCQVAPDLSLVIKVHGSSPLPTMGYLALHLVARCPQIRGVKGDD
jgi:hypothetical protein